MDEFDELLAQAREMTAPLPPALMRKVLDDAARLQPQPAAVPLRPSRGLWVGLLGVFGGGAALAGVGLAAVAGLFLGFVQPAALQDVAAALAAGDTLETLDLIPGIDALLALE